MTELSSRGYRKAAQGNERTNNLEANVYAAQERGASHSLGRGRNERTGPPGKEASRPTTNRPIVIFFGWIYEIGYGHCKHLSVGFEDLKTE